MDTTQIETAINSHKVITFIYEGHSRTVEPFTLGVHKDTGKVVLCAWQIAGYCESGRQPPWRLFTVSDICSVQVLDETFAASRPGYNPRDSRMSRIITAA